MVIPFEVDAIALRPDHLRPPLPRARAITVRRFDDYVQALEKAKVVLDIDRRKEIIRADAEQPRLRAGAELIHDEGLLEEVAGLVEWPVVMMGSFDEASSKCPRK